MMSEPEEQVGEARDKILNFMRVKRGYTLEQYDREENRMTPERIGRGTGLSAEIVARALDSLVADKTVKQSPDPWPELYTLRQ